MRIGQDGAIRVEVPLREGGELLTLYASRSQLRFWIDAEACEKLSVESEPLEEQVQLI
jgi:hypothetical protein